MTVCFRGSQWVGARHEVEDGGAQAVEVGGKAGRGLQRRAPDLPAWPPPHCRPVLSHAFQDRAEPAEFRFSADERHTLRESAGPVVEFGQSTRSPAARCCRPHRSPRLRTEGGCRTALTKIRTALLGQSSHGSPGAGRRSRRAMRSIGSSTDACFHRFRRPVSWCILITTSPGEASPIPVWGVVPDRRSRWRPRLSTRDRTGFFVFDGLEHHPEPHPSFPPPSQDRSTHATG